MQLKRISNLSFGTKIAVASASAELGLPNYNKRLTKGIIKAFHIISKNNKDDSLGMVIGSMSKNNSFIDTMELSYFNNKGVYQSSTFLCPQILETLSTRKIKKVILNTYNNLISSFEKRPYSITKWPNQKSNQQKISSSHQKQIIKLINLFGADDSSLAY